MLSLQNDDVIKALKSGEIIISHFSGTSMYPMLKSGKDRVVVAPVDSTLKKNDVPLYKGSNGKLVLHRIIKVKSDGYVIRGDNLYHNEYDVTDEKIVGILKGFYKGDKLYNCDTDFKYKLYVYFIRATYPLRYVFVMLLRPCLVKIKRFLKRQINFEKN